MRIPFFLLILLGSFTLCAEQPVWPGNFMDLETSWGTSIFVSDGDNLKTGGNIELGIGVQSLIKNFSLQTRGAYQWQYDLQDEIQPALKISFLLGHRDYYDGYYLEPLIGMAILKPVGENAPDAYQGLETGMEWGTRLHADRNIFLRSSLFIPFHNNRPVSISFGAGLSRKKRILQPLRPPHLSLTELSSYFSPDGDGNQDRYILEVKCRRPKSVASWSIQIYDPYGVVFYTREGQGVPPNEFIWNGRSTSGEWVSSAVDYRLILNVVDILGKKQEYEQDLQTGIQVIQDGEKWKIRIPSIVYDPNSSQLSTDSSDIGEKNLDILKGLTEIFNRFPGYTIQIEGHANHRMPPEERAGILEQEEILIPLSLERAESVRQALMELGIEGDRIICTGIGGADPLFPYGDNQNSWKNRRVEFILLR